LPLSLDAELTSNGPTPWIGPAIKYVSAYLRRRRFRVKSRERDRIGYDLEATKAKKTLHVEVKGVSGRLVQFIITKGEVNRAKSDPDFHLFVVTEARGASPKLHRYLGSSLSANFRLEPTAFMATPALPTNESRSR